MRKRMRMNSYLQQTCCNYPYSSPIIGLRIGLHDFTKERPKTQNWSLEQFWTNNIYSIKGRQKCHSSNSRISYYTSRLWLLLDYHVSDALHLMSKMWRDSQPTSKHHYISRGRTNRMTFQCKNGCGAWLTVSDSIRSKKGKCIPIEEHNNKPHVCRLNPFNRKWKN